MHRGCQSVRGGGGREAPDFRYTIESAYLLWPGALPLLPWLSSLLPGLLPLLPGLLPLLPWVSLLLPWLSPLLPGLLPLLLLLTLACDDVVVGVLAAGLDGGFGGQGPMVSWCLRWAFQAVLLTLMVTHGFLVECVWWQIVILY
jgi:hypothetical protein